MRGKASRALRWWTLGLVVTLAALVGLHFADRLVPAGWMGGGQSTHIFELSYTDAQGRDVAEPLVLTIGDDRVGGAVVGSWMVAGHDRPKISARSGTGTGQSKAQAEAAFLASMASGRSFESRFAPLVPLAVASPGTRARVEFRERLPGAYLMKLRSSFGFNAGTACTWAIVLPAWVWVLAVKWRKVLQAGPLGVCGRCGYDRAGLAAGAVCPECGGASGVGGSV